MEETRVANIPPASITWTDRPKVGRFQMGCGFLGLVMVLLQIIISIAIIAGTNGNYDPQAAVENNCPSGRVALQYLCVDQSLKDDYDAKVAASTCTTRRRLWIPNDELMQHEEHLAHHALARRLAPGTDTMWDRFGQHAEIPSVLGPLVFIFGILWILLLQKFAKACIYGALVLGVVFFVFLSIFPTLIDFAVCQVPGDEWITSDDQIGTDRCTAGGGTVDRRSGAFSWVFLIPAVVIAVLTVVFRKKINVAALCLSKCCLCIRQRPIIIGACFGVFVSFAFYIGMWVAFALKFFSHYEITCDEMIGTPKVSVKENGTLMKLMGILVIPTYIYFEMMIMVVVACGVGGWYFQDGADVPAKPALTGLKWAYSSSSGAIFLATVVTWPIIEIRNYIHSVWGKFALFPCLPCSWVYYIFYIFWCCFLRAYLAFTRFMLIAHTFHGGDIFATARNAWGILKKHLGGAVVTDTIAAYVLNMGVWVISVGFAFIAWIWMEHVMNRGFLEDLFTSTANGQTTLIIVVVMIGVISWLCLHSLLTIILCALVGQYMTGIMADAHPFMCGVFIGAICNIIFSFLAKIIQAGMDTIFYCFALEAEHAVAQSREGFAEITTMIKENIVKPLPAYLESAEANPKKSTKSRDEL